LTLTTLPDQLASGDHLIAATQAFYHGFMFFDLLLLRRMSRKYMIAKDQDQVVRIVLKWPSWKVVLLCWAHAATGLPV